MIVTEDGLTSIVKRGENGGRTLHHDAVVRRISAAGSSPSRRCVPRRLPAGVASRSAARRRRSLQGEKIAPHLRRRHDAAQVESGRCRHCMRGRRDLSADAARRRRRSCWHLRHRIPTRWAPGGWRSFRSSSPCPILVGDLPALPAHAARLHADLRARLHPDARRPLHLRARAARLLDAGPRSTSRATTTTASATSRRASCRRSSRARSCCGARRCGRGGWLFFIVCCICLAISACYEFIEWWAALVGGAAATDFLGTQGDVWDTQWDMLMALIGAIAAQVLLSRLHDRQLIGCPAGPVARLPETRH